jgi:two-component system LytT family response regulator
MKRLRTLIVDDERLARLSLRNKLVFFNRFDIVGEAASIESARKAVEELKPDLIFLDVQLSDGSGFDLLSTTEYNGKVVFITAYDEYAVRAFEVNAVDYLLKPVTKSRLKSLAEKIDRRDTEEGYLNVHRYNYDDRIMVEQKGYLHFLLVSDISFISSAKDYTVINTVEAAKYLVQTPMSGWEQMLPADHFSRVHRNAIVNLNRIEKTKKTGATAEIWLRNSGSSIKVSRSYLKAIKDRYVHK